MVILLNASVAIGWAAGPLDWPLKPFISQRLRLVNKRPLFANLQIKVMLLFVVLALAPLGIMGALAIRPPKNSSSAWSKTRLRT
jgi:hypothetical protein